MIAKANRWQVAAKIALIVFAVGLVYLPALRAGFVWDDEPLITANPLMRNLSGLGEIWAGSRTADYFPITNTAFWIDSRASEGPHNLQRVQLFVRSLAFARDDNRARSLG